jgi:hypothetical protein
MVPFQVEMETIQVRLSTIQVEMETIRVRLSTIQVEMGTIQVGLSTIQVKMGTIRVRLSTNQVILSTNRVILSTNQVKMGTIQVRLSTIQVKMGTIRVRLSTIQVEMETSRVCRWTSRGAPGTDLGYLSAAYIMGGRNGLFRASGKDRAGAYTSREASIHTHFLTAKAQKEGFGHKTLFEGGLIPKNPHRGGALGRFNSFANDGGVADPQYKMRKVRRTFSSRTKMPRCLRRGSSFAFFAFAVNFFFKTRCFGCFGTRRRFPSRFRGNLNRQGEEGEKGHPKRPAHPKRHAVGC